MKKDTILFKTQTEFDKNNNISLKVKLPNYSAVFGVYVFMFDQNGVYGFTKKSFESKRDIDLIMDVP